MNCFNDQGVDGLIDRHRRGRPRKISPEKGAEYRDFVRHPEKANQNHWTGKKFHGYLTKELDNEIGYRTVLRWLHEEGFRLKVPRSWPNGQDEEKRKAFIELLRKFLTDPDTDLWFLDQTGVEGDPSSSTKMGIARREDHRSLPGYPYPDECHRNGLPENR